MRNFLTVTCIACISVFFQGCLKDKLARTYTIYLPVYESKAEAYANIKTNPAQTIKSPGKIFLSGNFIYLNEVDKGVHVIDNTDPSHPVVKAFINIPGNRDIAIKGNTLYADLYADLVAIDISDPLHVKFVKALYNVFPERNYANGFVPGGGSVIIDWIKKDTTIPVQTMNYPIVYFAGVLSAAPTSNGAPPSTTGISGSTARFVVVNNFLYAVNVGMLNTIDITTPLDPKSANITNVGWSIETIYPLLDKLFLGSTTGMFIYDISDPTNPKSMAQFTHARACDPVIADGNTAYVTLNDGGPCGGFSNELDVIDIASLTTPSLLRIFPLTSPHGLAKDGNLLFVCDGKAGLREYDATNPVQPVLLKVIAGPETADVIASNSNLIVVAKDGLYQYDYSYPTNLFQKSKLSIQP